MSDAGVAVVMITHDRCDEVLTTLGRLTGLTEVAEVVVVDNASTDGTPQAVRGAYPLVRLLALDRNLGAAGRNVGVRATRCALVAFSDDDSWWEPGALTRAADLFARHERLGLLHGRIVLEPQRRTDPACEQMAAGPVVAGLPGPSVIGHLACGAVVRREAYVAAGGYSPLLGFGGEERLLSLDLASAGWQQCYVASVVAHHAPSPRRDSWPARWARYRRNDTLTAWLRLPASRVALETVRLLVQAARDPVVRREMPAFLHALPSAVRQRRTVPTAVWQQLLDSDFNT